MNLAELTAWAPRLLRSQSFPSMTLLGTFASKEEILEGLGEEIPTPCRAV